MRRGKTPDGASRRTERRTERPAGAQSDTPKTPPPCAALAPQNETSTKTERKTARPHERKFTRLSRPRAGTHIFCFVIWDFFRSDIINIASGWGSVEWLDSTEGLRLYRVNILRMSFSFNRNFSFNFSFSLGSLNHRADGLGFFLFRLIVSPPSALVFTITLRGSPAPHYHRGHAIPLYAK